MKAFLTRNATAHNENEVVAKSMLENKTEVVLRASNGEMFWTMLVYITGLGQVSLAY